jgi:hypothetical protein
VVEVRTLHGDVRVTPALDSRVRLAVRRSGDRTDPRQVEVAVERRGDTLRFCTRLPGRDGACEPEASLARGVEGDAEVDHVLALPAGSPLVVRTVYGDLDVRGVSAEVALATDHGRVRLETARGGEVRVVNGAIDLHLARLLPGAALAAGTTNGPIRVHVPRDLDGEVHARSENGAVHEGERAARDAAPVRARHWRLGAPRGAVRCASENGDIRLLRAR